MLTFAVGVADAAAVELAAEEIAAAWGHIDVWIGHSAHSHGE